MNGGFNDFNDPNGFNRRRRHIKYSAKPSPHFRAVSIVGMVFGIGFCIIGFTVVIPMAGAFGILWTLMAVAITVVSAYSGFAKRHVGPEIFIEDDMAQQPQQPSGSEPDGIEQRLERLNDLHDKGLVTDEEYEKKRQEILDEL